MNKTPELIKCMLLIIKCEKKYGFGPDDDRYDGFKPRSNSLTDES